MSAEYPPPSTAEVRSAIVRYAIHDALRVVAMWLIPLVFQIFNPWVRHWAISLAILVIGTFVIGGTTVSLPAISIQSLPPDHSSIWTPWRCCIFVGAYLALWSLTYVAIN